MRRREWFGWSTALVVGAAVWIVSFTGAWHQPWEHLAEPLGAVVFGQGLGQLIRGWWRVRHDQAPSQTDISE